MTQPELSIIVAHTGSRANLEAALAAVRIAAAGIATEVIVAYPEGVRMERELMIGADVRTIAAPSGSLVPVLWGLGAAEAAGRVIAFSTSQMRVSAGWARTLVNALNGDTVAAGGPIMPPAGASGMVTAGCLVRFSAFLPASGATSWSVRDVAGDNSAYLRTAIHGEADLLREGFWEVEFHRRFERSGHTMRIHALADATFVGPVHFRTLLRERFAHAKEFGASRVSRHGARRSLLLLAAPVVPLVLLARIGRRAWRIRDLRGRLLRALPAIGLLSAAWAAGEAAGALGQRQPPAA